MLSFVAHENFNNDILRGVWRRNPGIDIVRVQDIGLSGADNPTVLEWAAQRNRIVLTQDVTTLTRHALHVLSRGQRMPGVFEVNRSVPLNIAIDDLVLLAQCSLADEWLSQMCYLRLR